MKTIFEEYKFPFEKIRDGQRQIIEEIYQTCEKSKNLLICAPTGIGKTISALYPALIYAKKHKKKVICLTSRQIQTNQIISTINLINKSNKDLNFKYSALIAKKEMCAYSEKGKDNFNDFCKDKRDKKKCEPFSNLTNQELYEKKDKLLGEVLENQKDRIEDFISFVGTEQKPEMIDDKLNSCTFCPYEFMFLKSKESDLIICDYNHIIVKGYRDRLFEKSGFDLENSILIIDEAHNLDSRIRNEFSLKLDSKLIKNFAIELSKFVKDKKYDLYVIVLGRILKKVFEKQKTKEDSFVNVFSIDSELFLQELEKDLKENHFMKFEDMLSDLELIRNIVRQIRTVSYAGNILQFLKVFGMQSQNVIKIISKIKDDKNKLSNLYSEGEFIYSVEIKCIDPMFVSSKILNNTHASILMSATLKPYEMYRDIYGVERSKFLEVDSPFSKSQQLTLIDKEISTKFSLRCEDLYKKIAKKIEDILNIKQDKNAVVFFQSYDFLNKVISNINIVNLKRKTLVEIRNMNKQTKNEFVEEFKKKGFNQFSKVLFAVTSGNFSEGLDLPNKDLELVIIVGIPLAPPDIITKKIITHYDKKYGKGQEYGYINPAMIKIIQAGGRCIRTLNDKGVVVLMDNRFLWPIYSKNIPTHWHVEKSENYEKEIEKFYLNE